MAEKKKEEKNGWHEALPWGFILLISIAALYINAYNSGYADGRAIGIDQGAKYIPLQLENDYIRCSNDLGFYQQRSAESLTKLDVCQEKLVKAKKLTSSYAVCLREPPEGMNESVYRESGVSPLLCTDYWDIHKEVFAGID